MERKCCRLTKAKVCLCFVKGVYLFQCCKGKVEMLRIQTYDLVITSSDALLLVAKK